MVDIQLLTLIMLATYVIWHTFRLKSIFFQDQKK